MSKFSVKKPLTVFVAVIAVLVLGVVAYLNMTPDLLPNMDFPYVIVMTTYPGASPEKVETEITKPMEQSMATLEHIKEITSTSAENYSLVTMEFEEGVNLDTIGVDIQQSINTLQGSWDDMVSAPIVMKINPSMLPVMVAAVSMDGMSTVELTEFLNNELLNKLEGVTGVARVSATGMVTQQLHILLNQEKMDEALQELEKAKSELEKAKKELTSGQQQMQSGKDQLTEQTAAGAAELNLQLSQLVSTKSQLEMTLSILKAVQSGITALEEQQENFQKESDALLVLQEQAQQLENLRAQLQSQMDALQQSGKPQEEIQQAIEQLKNSEAYKAMEKEEAELAAKLALWGVQPEEITGRLTELVSAMESVSGQIEQLKKTLQSQNVQLQDLDQTIQEMESGLAQVNGGITALKDGQKTLEKAQMEGLLQLSNAATELSLGKATVESAAKQVTDGIDTLEKTRKDTLDKANVNKILTMDMVSQLLVAQNFSMPAGMVEGEGVSYMVSVGDKITTAKELEELLLFDMGMEGIEPVRLKDVAGVVVTDNSAETYAKLNGKDSVMLSFEKQSTYATAETSENLLARFSHLENEYPGLQFVSMMDQGDYIHLIVDSILSSLLLGAVFAVIILFLFLKDLRPTFITLCSIPVSVIFAIVLMYFSGVTINMISLSGLAVAVGMLVDNSVVVIENVYRLRSKGANAIQAAVSGAKQVAGAVTASTLTTVCVFAPIVFVEGITKQLFTDLALTMTYSLMASLIVSLTLVPAMASGMLQEEKQTKQPLLDKFLAAYRKAADWSLSHKAVVLGVSAALLVISAVWSISKGFIFMPKMDMSSITATITMPEDVSMEQAVAMADDVLVRIGKIEGIETAGAMMGGGNLLSGFSGGGDSKNVTVYVILSDETASGEAAGKQIEEACADMACEVTATSVMMDISMLSGSGISLKLFSNDMEQLKVAAAEAKKVLEQVDGVKTVDDGLGELVPAMHISVDRDKAMQKGITVAQIYMELAAALQTETTGAAMELDGTSTQVIIEKPAQSKLTADQLAAYEFTVTNQITQQEATFLLQDVATVEETTSLAAISRLAQRRYVTVSAGLEEGQNVTKVTAAAQKAMRSVILDKGVTYEFDGENEAVMEAVEQLGIMLLLGVLLVYLVMVAQFQSLKSPFIVMFTIPLAFTGGFVALLICGLEVSVISMIGFIMLTGIIVNNGIVLVDYINQLRLEGMERREAILEAGVTRMRPILMTTLTTILGLLDMAVRQSVGTSMIRPVAVVCIGGLLYATLMTLFVVPCIYDMVSKKALRNVRQEDLKVLDM